MERLGSRPSTFQRFSAAGSSSNRSIAAMEREKGHRRCDRGIGARRREVRGVVHRRTSDQPTTGDSNTPLPPAPGHLVICLRSMSSHPDDELAVTTPYPTSPLTYLFFILSRGEPSSRRQSTVHMHSLHACATNSHPLPRLPPSPPPLHVHACSVNVPQMEICAAEIKSLVGCHLVLRG